MYVIRETGKVLPAGFPSEESDGKTLERERERGMKIKKMCRKEKI